MKYSIVNYNQVAENFDFRVDAEYFKPEYALRPISTTFTATITNGSEWQNPGY